MITLEERASKDVLVGDIPPEKAAKRIAGFFSLVAPEDLVYEIRNMTDIQDVEPVAVGLLKGKGWSEDEIWLILEDKNGWWPQDHTDFSDWFPES